MTLRANYGLVLPQNYVSINETQMEYVDGGWDISFAGVKKAGFIPIGVYFNFAFTSSDICWILTGAAALTATFVGLSISTGVGALFARKAVVAAATIIAFVATIAATNDRLEAKEFHKKIFIGL